MTKDKGYEVVPFPKSRRVVIDLLEEGDRRHHVKGMLELDVTDQREFFRKYKEKTGIKLSFTGWITKCLAQGVSEHIQINAYKKGRRKIYIFNDVDVGLIVEREREGLKVPTKYIIRKANEKSFKEIHDEIRAVQTQKTEGPVLGEKRRDAKLLNFFASLPRFVRKMVFWYMRRNPPARKKMLGTCTVASVGMMGRTGGYGIVISSETLHVLIGGIAKKPGVIDDKIKVREYLNVTLMADHDVVDGAPFARFLQRFIDLVEEGYGLDEFKE